MHCRLLIPDALLRDSTAAGAQMRLPSIETVVARGRRSTSPWPGLRPWLLERFGVPRQDDWPSAPFALLGEGRAPGEAFWSHAEPVHLRADRDRVLVLSGDALRISAAEAGALRASLNDHFGPALHIEVEEPARWYARLESPPAGHTVDIYEARSALLTDSASLGWHALMNEAQMLLHAHPVNEAREARGEPVINGVWFSNGGRLTAVTAPDLRGVHANDVLARGLATAAGVRASRLPARMDDWLEASDADGVHLFVIDTLSSPARAGNAEAWRAALDAVEEGFVSPLVRALERGRIGMLTLHLGGEEQLLSAEAARADLRHFWRRRKPLASHAPAQ